MPFRAARYFLHERTADCFQIEKMSTPSLLRPAPEQPGSAMDPFSSACDAVPREVCLLAFSS